MSFPPELLALAEYLAGEFDNREQAMADPAWYVHLRLWQRPVPLFTDDSITLFAEQANIVNLDKPYRPRLMRIQKGFESDAAFLVQYYMPKEPAAVGGAGSNPTLLSSLTPNDFDLLPGCILTVRWQQLSPDCYHFWAALPADTRCCFTYQGNTQQVSLGFEASQEEFLSYDKGIDSITGNAKWGAIAGPFRFRKRQNYQF